MEVRVASVSNVRKVVLLDDEMRIVEPVYLFLEFQRKRKKAFNTLKAQAQDLKVFFSFLRERGLRFDELVPLDVLAYVEYLRSGGSDFVALYKESARANSTINRMISTLQTFYGFAEIEFGTRNCMLTEAVSRPLSMPREMLYHARRDNLVRVSIYKAKPSAHKVKLVSEDELNAVLEQLPRHRDRLLLTFLFLTGARIQEALDLRIDDVPIPDESLSVGVFQEVKSKGKVRDIYAPMGLIVEIDQFILGERAKSGMGSGHVFVAERPGFRGRQLAYANARQITQRAMEKAGVRFNFHDLRHTFNTNLAEAGVDVSVRQLLLGHEHASTTERYTHLSDPYIFGQLEGYWRKSSLLREGGRN